jgi:hypothetical protein
VLKNCTFCCLSPRLIELIILMAQLCVVFADFLSFSTIDNTDSLVGAALVQFVRSFTFFNYLTDCEFIA